MSQKQKLVVQKYGGATLADSKKIKNVAKRIFDLYRSDTNVVVVVSAMGDTTNQLISLANEVSERPSLRELDMLLTTGERISMSLLSMALNDLGATAISFTGSQAGILTDDAHISANILEIKPFRVEEALKDKKIVILAGFQGVSQKTKEITTLGRGGSDISAVAMAAQLKADHCEILKDVDGIYSADPKIIKNAKQFSQLNYFHLLEMTQWGAKVLNTKSVQLAKEKNIKLYVGPSIEDNQSGTWITNDFNFSDQQPLSITSHSDVLIIECSSFESFQDYLTKHQISQVQLLINKKDQFYITAPKETILQILSFTDQTFYKIAHRSLSSVSLIFQKKIKDQNFNIEKPPDIEIFEECKTEFAMHFFCKKEKRENFIQHLHSYIEF